MVKNKLGCSLPFGYIIGDPSLEYEAIFGSVDDCLAVFRSHGIVSVELRCVTQSTSLSAVSRAVEKLAGYGMSSTIHGFLPEIDSGDHYIPAIFELPSDQECIVTLHAYAGDDHSSEWYALKTVDVLKALLAHSGDNVKFALETNRKRPPRNDPGGTYEGVVDMIDSIGSPRVGACWDFGHSAFNVINGFMDFPPPPEFLDKVIQTHIHDLSPDNRTHFPLTCGKMPLGDYVNVLIDSGYAGIFNLELAVDRWSSDANEKRKSIIDSMEILSTMLSCS